MTQTRRTFIAGSAVAGAGLMASANVATASVKINQSGKEGVLKLSSQDWPLPGKTLEQELDFLEQNGIEGYEPGGKDLHKKVKTLQSALKGRNIKISAICAGFDGAPCSEFASVRKRSMESMKRILTAAGELESTGLIFVPAFNSQSQAGIPSARFLLVDFLNEIADHAQSAGTRLLLEPLNRHETWYVRTLADAAQICKEIDHPAIRMMGDFYHMGREEPCDYAAFLSARKYMHHVHLASRPNRKQPGYDKNDDFRDGDDFRPGFKALKEIGYQDYCSFECGCEGKKEIEMPKSIAYLKQQWKEA